MGADLVCYAGKYFDGPHSTGLIVGRKELVDLAAVNGFIGFETSAYRTIGRPMKIDRQEIVGAVVALREWLAMNHEERLLRYGERAEAILAELRSVPGIEAYRVSEREAPRPVFRDGVRVVLNGVGRSATSVSAALRAGDPSVAVAVQGEALNVSVAFFTDEDLAIVARRLREALTE